METKKKKTEMNRNSRSTCKIYGTFGQCAFNVCKNSHEGPVPNQEYFITVLKSDPGTETTVTYEKGEKKFLVANNVWSNRGAKKGDLVLFQASSKEVEPGNHSYGRVLFRGEDESNTDGKGLWTGSNFRRITNIPEVHTLDTPGTKRFDDAYSVEDCGQDCKKIGIHVFCPALVYPSKIASSKILPYKSHQVWSHALSGKETTGLQKKQIVGALTVYVHTSCKETDATAKLELSAVKVLGNYEFGKDRESYGEDFNHVYNWCAGRTKLIHDQRAHRNVLEHPDVWKEFVVVDQLMSTFRSAIENLPDKPQFLKRVTKESIPVDQNLEGSTTVFRDLVDNAAAEGAGIDEILPLAAAGLRSENDQEATTNWLPKACWDVGRISDNTIVPCTSPLRKVYHHVNQQIAIHSMLRPNEQLYSETELLGILGIRFETPKLWKARLNKVSNDTCHLEYPGMFNVPETIYELPYEVLTQSDVDVVDCKAKITLTAGSCSVEQYCNRKIVQLERKSLKDFLDAFENGRELPKLKSDNDDERSPYERDGSSTTLILQDGIELQIQISKSDAWKNDPLKWRLLRIGSNCHMCFTHLNNPELAFMSNREDVRQSVTSQRIQRLFDEGRLRRQGVTVRNLTIDWNDAYYSGGSFDVSDSHAEVIIGSLLCIRKEISPGEKQALHGEEVQQQNEGEQNGQESEPRDQGVDPNASEVDYVWCCHGVVSTKEGENVKFKVCTLSQTEAIETEEVRGTDFRIVQRASGFWVEVIDSSDD